jgi:plastocyanin
MKTTNTIRHFFLFCLTLFVSSWSFGQSVFDIQVSDFAFTPNAITINAGDTVRWTNVSGTHNVDGSTTTYPSNPMPFSNPSDGSGAWVFDVVFTIAGTYQYQCGFHASMLGTITVNSTAAISENEIEGVRIYPNPARADFTVVHKEKIESIELYDMEGQRVVKLNGNSQYSVIVDSHKLAAGTYSYIINDVNGKLLHGSVLIEP